MPTNKRFLIIDDNADGRALLSRTLLRTFPQAAVVECQDCETAAQVLAALPVAAVLAHRAGEYDLESLILTLRRMNATVPIIALSGLDRSEKALAAGATRFLNYDQWLMAGKVVEDVVSKETSV